MIKVKELRAYQQVKHVLGAKEAERQLFIALNSKDTRSTHISIEAENPLILDMWDLFLWMGTPQGYEYWCYIADKYKPGWTNP